MDRLGTYKLGWEGGELQNESPGGEERAYVAISSQKRKSSVLGQREAAFQISSQATEANSFAFTVLSASY